MMDVTLKNGIRIGKTSKTALSALVGFNRRAERWRSYATVESLARDHHDDVAIVGDVSMCADDLCAPVWKVVLERTPFAAATVPIYQSVGDKGIVDRTRLVDTIRKQAEAGVSIITIHATASVSLWKRAARRLIPCTSRGGSMVIASMLRQGVDENPFLSELDTIASIAASTHTILSIGSTFRSGTVIDAVDEVYMTELAEQIRIAEYLRAKGVSSLIETPGHASARSILDVCSLLRKSEVPIMPLGPMPTDIAFEYDDLAGCIGSVLMALNGCADVLTVVTKEEHAGGIPSYNALDDAIRKYRVAAHIIDMQKVGDYDEDRRVSELRAKEASCVLGAESSCGRCSFACPLQFVQHAEKAEKADVIPAKGSGLSKGSHTRHKVS